MQVTIDGPAIELQDQLEYRAEFREFKRHEDPRTTPVPISSQRLQLADANILDLSPLVAQLIELWNGPESDDCGRLRPTQCAFDATVELLVDAALDAQAERRQIPHGCVSTDSEGGVRIEWIRDKASVHLAVPPARSKAAYVYHEVGGSYATEDATPRRLAYWLRAIS